MKKIIALIGARGGSKGIKNKNIVYVGGYPLIAYSVVVSKLSKWIQRTIVSTDSQEIKKLAIKYGAEVPFLRPAEYATDGALDIAFFEHALKWFKKRENFVPDLIVHLRPTTPLRDVRVVDKAISFFLQSPEASSMRSVELMRESPYKMFLKDDDYLKPFVSTEEGEFYNLPRQRFPKVYRPNGYVDIIRPSTIKNGSLHGDKILAFETEKIIELDSTDDLKSLCKWYKESPTYDYLWQNY